MNPRTDICMLKTLTAKANIRFLYITRHKNNKAATSDMIIIFPDQILNTKFVKQ